MSIMTEKEKQIEARLSTVIMKLSDSGLEKLVAVVTTTGIRMNYAAGMAAMADLMAAKHAD